MAPARLFTPRVPCNGDGGGSCYGAGQPTVVLRDGAFHMWYTDTTALERSGIWYAKSNNGVNWANHVFTTVRGGGAASVDVKFDTATGRYVMIELASHTPNPPLSYRWSDDGIAWTDATVLGTAPNYSNNIGVEGTPDGYIDSTAAQIFIGFGAPYGLAFQDSWGHWNLYGAYTSLSGSEPTTCTDGFFHPPGAPAGIGYASSASGQYCIYNSWENFERSTPGQSSFVFQTAPTCMPPANYVENSPCRYGPAHSCPPNHGFFRVLGSPDNGAVAFANAPTKQFCRYDNWDEFNADAGGSGATVFAEIPVCSPTPGYDDAGVCGGSPPPPPASQDPWAMSVHDLGIVQSGGTTHLFTSNLAAHCNGNPACSEISDTASTGWLRPGARRTVRMVGGPSGRPEP